MSTSINAEALEAARKAGVPNILDQKLAAGQPVYAFSIKLIAQPEIVHYVAAAGYDAVLIDLEHGTVQLDITSTMSITALALGITPIVRVPANTSEWISRVLDGGAQAVIVPHIGTAAEARNVVRCAKFAPMGERSATAYMPLLRYSNVIGREGNIVANELTTVICMIETEEGLDNVADIAAVEGVDVLLIGSADLTQDMGIPGEFDSPKLAAAYEKVVMACRKASTNGRRVMCGMGGLNGRPDLVEKFANLYPEARFVMAGADNGTLLGAMRKGAASFKDIPIGMAK